jgi:hypothetical protein
VFIDEFYTRYEIPQDPQSQFSTPNFRWLGGTDYEAVGWKFGVPNTYGGANPITMRLFLTLEYPDPATYGLADLTHFEDHQIFELAALRREPDNVAAPTGYGLYGGLEPIVVGPQPNVEILVPGTAGNTGETVLLVVDIPLQPAMNDGLGITTIAAGDMLYFGMAWGDTGDPCQQYGEQWRIHGVEFYETEAAVALSGAALGATTETNCP